jgi:hypothetical protein
MKIDYAIVSTNENPLYSEFWPIVKKLWFHTIGIKPILVKIGENDNIIENRDSIIHEIKKVENLDTGFQSQISRMYITKYYQDKVCITSDIDMFPLSKKYFVDDLFPYNIDSLIIMSSDAYGGTGRYPICYNVGLGKTFNEIMEFDDKFSDYCDKMQNFNLGWDCDEIHFGKMVDNYKHKERIVKLRRGWINNMALQRIDRVRWEYNIRDLKMGLYIDSHSLRPYSQYKSQIHKLIDNFV